MNNDFSVVEQLNTPQLHQLHQLFQEMWWSEGRTLDEIAIFLKNSLSFALIENKTGNLVGYARVLTDEVKYAYIFDVMLEKTYRGKGLAKTLINSIFNHPKLQNIKIYELTCKPDMVEFYEQFKFSEDYGDVRPMRYRRAK